MRLRASPAAEGLLQEASGAGRAQKGDGRGVVEALSHGSVEVRHGQGLARKHQKREGSHSYIDYMD